MANLEQDSTSLSPERDQAPLRFEDGRYLLDLKRLEDVLAQNAEFGPRYHWAITELERASALQPTQALKPTRVALLPRSRVEFLAGLLASWTIGASALLSPQNRLLPKGGEFSRLLDFSRFSETGEVPANLLATVSLHPQQMVAEVLTSGSSGEPQLHPKTAAQLFGEALCLKEVLDLRPLDVVVATTAPNHVYGLLFSVLAPLASGARVVTSPHNEPDAFQPHSLSALLHDSGATHLITVPAHLRALAEARVSLCKLRLVVSSAASLSQSDAQHFEERTHAPVLDVLGSTETGGIATRRAALEVRWRPLPGVLVSLSPSDTLTLKSPFLPTSDNHSGVATSVTAERVAVHPDGTFEYLGRGDSVVKVGGKRVDLGEIEAIARAFPSVEDAVCLSRPVASSRGNELLLVIQQKHVKTSDALALVREHLRARLDPVLVPRRLRSVAKLPRDERGKLKRSDLLALFKAPASHAAREVTSPSLLADELVVPFFIAKDDPRFVGHFPGDPILPAAIQLADFLLPAARHAFKLADLVELSRVKWKNPLRPGTHGSLHLRAKVPDGEAALVSVTFEMRASELVLCSGTMRLAALATSPSLDP